MGWWPRWLGTRGTRWVDGLRAAGENEVPLRCGGDVEQPGYGFRQKPVLDYDICSGYYALDVEGVEGYFPERGGFEDTALPGMAANGVLYSRALEGEWITINNLKQLEAARQKLSR